MEDFSGSQTQRPDGAAGVPARPQQSTGSRRIGRTAGAKRRLDTAPIADGDGKADRSPLRRTVSVAGVEADELPAQKKSLHAAERDSEANQKRRIEFLEKIRATSPERLIYLDESGVTTQMTRLYARSRNGARIHEAAPQGHWKILTILGAISTRGMIAAQLTHHFKPKWLPIDSSSVLEWTGFIVGLVALIIAIKTDETVAETFECMNDALIGIETWAKAMPTRHVGPFPDHLEEICNITGVRGKFLQSGVTH